MLIKIAFVLISLIYLSMTVNAQSNQTCSSSATYCEACLSNSGNSSNCGWCTSGVNSACVNEASCNASNGTFITSASQCQTCVTGNFSQNVCQFGSNNRFLPSYVNYCMYYNSLVVPSSSSSSSNGDDSCSYSQECLRAILDLACTTNCAFCTASDSRTLVANRRICSDQCNSYNTSCAEEISNGCSGAPPLSDLTCAPYDSDNCKPRISANINLYLTSTSTTSPSTTNANGTTTTSTIGNSTTSPSGNSTNSSAASLTLTVLLVLIAALLL